MNDFDWLFLLVMLVGIVIVVILPERDHFNDYKDRLGKKKKIRRERSSKLHCFRAVEFFIDNIYKIWYKLAKA